MSCMSGIQSACAVDRSVKVDRPRNPSFLSREEEQRLAFAWRENGDIAARDRIVESHLPLAISMVAKATGKSPDFDDLVQEATVGLIEAIDRFEPERGLRFATYARWWIRSTLQDGLTQLQMLRPHSSHGVVRVVNNLRRAVRHVEKQAASEGRMPGESEILRRAAAHLQVDEKTVLEVVRARSVVSVDAVVSGSNGEGGAKLLDTLVSDTDGQDTVEQSDWERHVRDHILAALSLLPHRERIILERRRLTHEPVSLQILADEFGVTRERVRQLEEKAIARMRDHLVKRRVDLSGIGITVSAAKVARRPVLRVQGSSRNGAPVAQAAQ